MSGPMEDPFQFSSNRSRLVVVEPSQIEAGEVNPQ
jgi:hypothetical protein